MSTSGNEAVDSFKSKSPVNSGSNKNRQIKNSTKEDEICDNWEQLDPQKIEKSLQLIKFNSEQSNTNSQNEEKNFTNLNSSSQNLSSTNAFLPQPAIKILKRPESNKNLTESMNPNPNASAPSLKSFEQREKEYAEARLRILGSAHPDETNNTAMKHSSSNSSFNQLIISNDNYQNSKNYSNNQRANTNTYNISNQYNRQHQQHQLNEFSIIREPIGPDGTLGFIGNFSSPTSASTQNKNSFNNNKNFLSK